MKRILLSLAAALLLSAPAFASQPLHGNTSSKVYHAADCEHYMRKTCTAEFATARQSTQKKIGELCGQFPEVADFVSEFLPSYGKTLDELLA